MSSGRLNVFFDAYDRYVEVGHLDHQDRLISFAYSEEYINSPSATPIYGSLPLIDRSFQGPEMPAALVSLLPEGRRREALARIFHISKDDDYALLEALGGETIGGLVFTTQSNPEHLVESYEYVGEDFLKEFAYHPELTVEKTVYKTRLSLAGEMPKIGIYIHPDTNEIYLPNEYAPSTHIAKAPSSEYANQTINEALCLLTAKYCGLEVPEFSLYCPDSLVAPTIIVRRYDRPIPDNPILIDGCPRPYRLHQEDFCQLLGIYPEEKYQEQRTPYAVLISEGILKHTARPRDILEGLVEQIVFHHLIGDCDGHLKNYSLVRSNTDRRTYLAPCYDINNTSIYLNLARDEGIRIGSAQTIDSVTLEDFSILFDMLSVPDKEGFEILEKMASRVLPSLEKAFERLYKLGYSEEFHTFDKIYKDAETRIERLFHQGAGSMRLNPQTHSRTIIVPPPVPEGFYEYSNFMQQKLGLKQVVPESNAESSQVMLGRQQETQYLYSPSLQVLIAEGKVYGVSLGAAIRAFKLNPEATHLHETLENTDEIDELDENPQVFLERSSDWVPDAREKVIQRSREILNQTLHDNRLVDNILAPIEQNHSQNDYPPRYNGGYKNRAEARE